VASRAAVAAIPWWAVAVVAGAAGAAWIGGGVYARRQIAAQLPPPAGAEAPAAIRQALSEADSRARAAPSAATVGALAQAYHAHQRPLEAIALYRLAAGLAPDDVQWTYLRGVLHEERGEAAEAEAAFRAVVAGAPGLGHAWFRLGELAFKAGRLDEAAAAYARARDAAPEPPFVPPGGGPRQPAPLPLYARLGLARVAIDRGDPAAAARDVRAILEAYPAFGPARGLLGEAERRTGTGPAPSTRLASRPYVPPADPRLDAVVASSRHTDVLLKHAGLAARAGDTAWREFLLQRAHDAGPDDLNVLMELSALRQSQGRLAEAFAVLQRHEALAPGDHHALVQQGKVLADLGRLAEAEAVLRRAVAVRDTTAQFNLGAVLDQLGRWDEARARYEQALAIDPFNTSALNNLASGLDRHGATAAALALFERAIAIAPDQADYYTNYGNALIQAGRLDAAVEALAVAITLDPRAANAHNNLGIAFAQQQRLDLARQAFEKALQIDPSHANARRNLALTQQILSPP
jgi:tetratricopeptide (TPR) repeat protein